MAKYYNVKKIKRPSFEEGDKVYLLCKNIIIKRLNNKLNFKKLRLFTINDDKDGPNNILLNKKNITLTKTFKNQSKT